MPHPTARLSEYERALLAQAAEWPGYVQHGELTVAAMQALARQEGLDFATALLFDRVCRLPEHTAFIGRLERFVDEVPRGGCLDETVVIVPGAFYNEFPHTGADGRLLREEAAKFGCESDLVPLPSFGRLAETAPLLCNWLDARPEEPVIL